MPFSGIEEEHAKALTALLEEYCSTHGITGDKERDWVAAQIASLFRSGVQSTDLMKAILESGKFGLHTDF